MGKRVQALGHHRGHSVHVPTTLGDSLMSPLQLQRSTTKRTSHGIRDICRRGNKPNREPERRGQRAPELADDGPKPWRLFSSASGSYAPDAQVGHDSAMELHV
jgi:hypothetical protein